MGDEKSIDLNSFSNENMDKLGGNLDQGDVFNFDLMANSKEKKGFNTDLIGKGVNKMIIIDEKDSSNGGE